MLFQADRCPATNIAKADLKRAGACTGCDIHFEDRFPKGTRIYAYDELIVHDGSRVAHFPSPAKTWCDDHSFIVMDPLTNETERFSTNARIAKILDYRKLAVKPGEPVPWDLRRDLRLGIARLKFVKR